MFGKLFQKKAKAVFGYAKINAPLKPEARGQMFEDPLQARLEESKLGVVTGGGAMMDKSGEILYCGIDVDMFDVERAPAFICTSLNRRGAPKGSELQYEAGGRKIVVPFGVAEGVAVYMNGTDLPEEVYKTCDSGVVIDTLQKLVETEDGGEGCVVETWVGPRETAVYMLGVSAEGMMGAIGPFIGEYPLCEKARVVRFA